MPTHHLVRLKELLEKAFDAVGCRMPVEQDDNGLYVRDLCIELDGDAFLCFEAQNPDQPLFVRPLNSPDEMASSAAVHIIKGIIARAVSES
jgi:hypothetical protein